MEFEKAIQKMAIFVSSLVVAVLASLPRVEDYSVSLYTQIPLFYRVTAAIVISISVIACSFCLYYRRERTAIFALLPVLTLSTAFPFLPRQLGYIVKFGDQMNHAGYIRDILATGDVPPIIYPGLHIHVAATSLITDISPALLLSLLASVASVCFFCTTVGFARYIGVPSAAPLAIAPLVAALTAIAPSALTYMTLLPIVVYSVLRYADGILNQAKRRSRFVCLAFIAGTMWMFHVVPSIIATVFVSLVTVLQGLQRGFDAVSGRRVMYRLQRVASRTNIRSPSSTGQRPTHSLLQIGLTGFLWTTFTVLFERIVTIGSALFVSSNLRGPSLNTESLSNTLFGEFGLSLFDVAFLAVRKYGELAVVCVAAGMGVIICLRPIKSKQRYCLPISIAILIVVVGIWSGLEATIGVVPRLNFVRVLRPVEYLGIAAGGIALHAIIRVGGHLLGSQSQGTLIQASAVVIGGVILLLTTGTVTGALLVTTTSAYNTPATFQANRQVLPSDIGGMNWYFTYKDQSINTTTLWRYNFRYVSLLLRPEQREKRGEELDGASLSRGYRSPAHFGYPNNSTFRQTVGCRYYIEGAYDRATYLQARVGDKFVRADFRRLQGDPTVRKIYANGNMNVSKVGTC